MCVCPSVCLSIGEHYKVKLLLSTWSDCVQIFRVNLIPCKKFLSRLFGPRGPPGQAQPKKGLLWQIYLLSVFCGRWVMSHLFRNRRMRKIKCFMQNFDYWPAAQENGACRGEWPKYWNFRIFHKPTLKLTTVEFLFNATFWFNAPWGHYGYPPDKAG